MITIEQLQSLQKIVTPIALDVYDKENTANTVLPMIAQVINRKGRGKKVPIEWWAAFPQMREWLDEKTIQSAFKEDMELTIKPYEITYGFDRLLQTFDDALVSAQDLAPKIAAAFARGKTLESYKLIRDNGLSYDGQNFFDTDHTHPDGSTFSNVFVQARSADATPTAAEAMAELKEAMSVLQENQIIRNELVSAAAAQEGIVVIVKHFNVWSAYYELLTAEKIGDTTNIFRGKFQLLRDFAPATTTDYTVDFIQALPGGPRPVVMVVHEEVKGLQFGAVDLLKREVPFGMEAQYAFGLGFPQTACQRHQS